MQDNLSEKHPEQLKEKIKELQKEAFQELLSRSFDEKSLEDFRIRYLGRQGKLTQILKDIGALSPEDRPGLGQLANTMKISLTQKISELSDGLKKSHREKLFEATKLDVTLPGRHLPRGSFHPLSQMLEDSIALFKRYGFQVAEGPEVESDYYNFEALNIPKNHPARDMQDTFYISEDWVLRTHTSPVQIRVMEKFNPPLRIIVPGTVYRHDADTSHSPMFHQIEGLCVDEKISFAHLKGILTYFIHELFSPQTKVRFRPSYFPFTEPSAELDMSCIFCLGKGCRVCKQSGWLEVAGCGMVHPAVFKAVKYNTEKVSGFAFGMGIERLTMLRYRIDDIRLFYENDLRFLEQFQ